MARLAARVKLVPRRLEVSVAGAAALEAAEAPAAPSPWRARPSRSLLPAPLLPIPRLGRVARTLRPPPNLEAKVSC